MSTAATSTIIGRAVERARDAGLPCVVVTFDPHPSEVVRPGSHPACSPARSTRRTCSSGSASTAMCVLPFTLEFSRLPPDEFVHPVLVEGLHAAAVVVGENFRFGHKAAGDVGTLADLGGRFGFVAERRAVFSDTIEGAPTRLSSTYVRSCVQAGDVEAAAARSAAPTGSTASSSAATGAAATSATRRPTCRPRRTPRCPPTASTRAGCTSRWQRRRTPLAARPSRSAPTPPSRAVSAAWRPTPSTPGRPRPLRRARRAGVRGAAEGHGPLRRDHALVEQIGADVERTKAVLGV